ncbi:hypothetical protein EN938_05865 [Mesorhizobium sp. M7A.F.Ca.US.001.02.1.1]|nr:hypothetical protein EN938_05865 [Mesorhizobium sp. M7A.F.Ca.US.001.02.1.1]
MAIACLGWGSLIWCQKALPVIGGWQTDGPLMPIEFTRQSNDKRITLVITPDAPPLRTLWVALSVKTLAEAKAVLAAREGISDANIKHSLGAWSAGGGSPHGIGDWAAGKGLAHVVWTALKPKMGTEYRTPSIAEVLAHLTGLSGHDRDRAEEYVRMTPRQITTPYRAAIEQALGWTPQGLG